VHNEGAPELSVADASPHERACLVDHRQKVWSISVDYLDYSSWTHESFLHQSMILFTPSKLAQHG